MATFSCDVGTRSTSKVKLAHLDCDTSVVQVARHVIKQIGEAGKQRQWRQAANLLDDMLRTVVKPTIFTYSALISLPPRWKCKRRVES